MDIIQELEDAKDIRDCINLIQTLNQLQGCNNRWAIISALQQSKEKAPIDISTLEFAQGDIFLVPWDRFSNLELQRKLHQYQQGLRAHCVNIIGQKALDKLLTEQETRSMTE